MWVTSICHAALATPLSSSNLARLALKAGLADKPAWSSLLHVAEGKANIRTKEFLLSLPNFSLENELTATVDFLYDGNTSHVCRFPARYLWLKNEIDLPALPIDDCADLNEFKLRAPTDTISIVFASENLAQPSSMMGHILLKLSGTNAQHQPVAHAISFITDAGGINLPKLFFDSMVVGKQGFFTLSPYEEKLSLYLRDEQRSIWEFDLALNSTQRALVRAHLIELKQTQLTYFFQKYNCATVVDFILSIGAAQQLPVDALWLTPKDVIKRARTLNLIQESRIIPPNRWLIRALSEQVDSAVRRGVKDDVEQMKPIVIDTLNADDDQIKLQLAMAYQGYLVETKQVGTLADNSVKYEQARQYRSELAQLFEKKYKNSQLEANAFKNPLDTPQDSQLTYGVSRRGQNTFLRLGFTPASHHLDDDNRQYFAESELLLFDVSLLKNIATKQLLLDRFIVYSAKSFIPHDEMSGGLSGVFRIGIEPQRNAEFKMQNTALISGAVGKTWRSAGDIDLFAILAAGVAIRHGTPNIFTQPELGIIVREIFDMKSVASVSLTSNYLGDRARYAKYRFTQSKYFTNKPYTLQLIVESERQKSRRESFFEINLKYLF